MILALAFGRHDIDKFLSEMSADDYLRWREFYLRSPWGPTRDDMRNSVLVTLLLSAFGGKGGDDLPQPVYPYWHPQTEMSLEAAMLMDRCLEPNGEGGYRWKDGQKPQALIDEEARIAAEEAERKTLPMW